MAKMVPIRIKKGYRLDVKGRPALEMETLKGPGQVAVLPERIPFIKPRLMADVGDSVKVGSLLFVDKRNPDIKFLSPGGGKIIEINFGPRRVIREIVILLDPNEACVDFPTVSDQTLASLERKRLVQLLLDGGLWPLIREFPFRDIAAPDYTPPLIFVNLDSKEPFTAQPEMYLQGSVDLFKYGINVLKKLAADGSVYIYTGSQNPFVLKELNGLITHTVEGLYPADDPGVLLYHIKKSSAENRSWFISAQDVLLIAHLLQQGKYPIERTVAVAGSSALQRKHFRTRIGAPLNHLAQPANSTGDVRFIVGGIFRGYTGSSDTYMGLYETALSLIPEGNEKEFLALFNPGYQKPSYSRTFLSNVNRSEKIYNCNQHGGERACIACMHCADVCPVDILPQMTYKAILAEEVEEYLEHGLLDCVECGLCSYVCPSKIELTGIFKATKASYAKERA